MAFTPVNLTKPKDEAPQDVVFERPPLNAHRSTGMKVAEIGTKGILGAPSMMMDAAYNAGAEFVRMAGGNPPKRSMYDYIDNWFKENGSPAARNDVEKVVHKVLEGSVSGRTAVEGGKMLASGVNKVAQRVGKMMTASPVHIQSGAAMTEGAVESAKQAGLGPVGQFATGVAASVLTGGGKPRKISSKEIRKGSAKVREAERAFGLEGLATSAEANKDLAKLGAQLHLSHTKPFRNRAALQNNMLATAFSGFTKGLSKLTGLSAAKRVKKASVDFMKQLRTDQKKASSVHYDASKKDFVSKDDMQTLNLYLSRLKTEVADRFDKAGKPVFGAASKAVGRIQTRLNGQNRNVHRIHTKVSSWIQKEIDTLARGDDNVDGDALVKLAGDADTGVIGVRKQLQDILRKSSKEYDAGYKTFRQHQALIDNAKGRIIGLLADGKDGDVITRLEGIFKNQDLPDIRSFKRSMDSVDPEAWPAMFKTFLNRGANKLKRTSRDPNVDTPLPTNVPKDFNSKIFDTQLYDKLIAVAPNKEIAKNMKYLRIIAEAYGEARPAQSYGPETTAAAKEMAGSMDKAAIYLASFVRWAGSTSALVAARSASSVIGSHRRQIMTEILLSPKYAQQMSQVRRLGWNNRESVLLMNAMILSAEKDFAKQQEESPEQE